MRNRMSDTVRLCGGMIALAAFGTSAMAEPGPRVRIDTGVLEGRVEDGVAAFKGIPYAAPPVGEWRWRAPRPTQPWQGIRPAATFGNDCVQRLGPGMLSAFVATGTSSEDCLYLNIWKPARPTTRKLPVMVWIYGGAFISGAGSMPIYSGAQFARQGVLLVNFNYRVGRFGFFAFPALSQEQLAEPKGNYGYLDQIGALNWIRKNIAAFGGDPDNVTIFGESAGGVSVNSLLTIPAARGLFQKAISQSGGGRDGILTGRPLNWDNADPFYPVSAETIGVNFARQKGVEGTDAAALARLRALSTADILDDGKMAGPDGALTFSGPVLDGQLVTATAESTYKAGRQARATLMIGANSNDSAGGVIRSETKEQFFSRFGPLKTEEAMAAYDPSGTSDLQTLLARADNDYGQAEPARFAADTFAGSGSPAYLYRFSYIPVSKRETWVRGAQHGAEIPFVFGNLPPYLGSDIAPQDRTVVRMVQSYWVNFAMTGNPNAPGLPVWPRHVRGKDQIFDFHADGNAGAGPDPWKPRLDLTQKSAASGIR